MALTYYVVGFGLLEEMSLAELREKLEQVKKEREEETEKKRVENLKKIGDKNNDLKAKMSEIQAVRQEKAAQNAEKRNQKLKEAAYQNKDDDRYEGLERRLPEKVEQDPEERAEKEAQARLKILDAARPGGADPGRCASC